jgi:hypothetical protein
VVEAGARSYRPPDGTATLLATRWREREQDRIASITSDPDPARQASLLRDELLRVIDAKVALEHEMETLQRELVFTAEDTDDSDTRIPGRRAAPHPSTELTGKPAPPSRLPAAPEAADGASRD